ncbi:MAG TPA: hypothetical protein H9733_09370 [Candidatus Anaerotignum merdipullorum]|nr:hypothetical protein [Candidatus Anaerotignum merdipullorum]
MKLKLTDSPGIAGGFYWINPKQQRTESFPLQGISCVVLFDAVFLHRQLHKTEADS